MIFGCGLYGPRKLSLFERVGYALLLIFNFLFSPIFILTWTCVGLGFGLKLVCGIDGGFPIAYNHFYDQNASLGLAGL